MSLSVANPTAQAHRQAVERVIAAMQARYDEPLLLQDLAEIALLSPSHLTRVFRAVTGSTPGQFLATVRLEEARRLLLTTELSVTDICMEVGYSSLGSFSSQFSQFVGLPPSQVRRLRARLGRPALPSLSPCQQAPQDASWSLRGQVQAATDEPGLTVVGLFQTPLPKGQPLSCTSLAQPGPYCLHGAGDGRYYLFAAMVSDPALLWGDGDPNQLWLGRGEPIQVRGGRVRGSGEIRLRPRQPIDPPLLVDLLNLMTQAAQAS